MAAQPLPLTLEEFHRLYDGGKPAYEYWYGAAVQKSMPTMLHGVVQTVIGIMLENTGWNTATEVRLKVVSEAEPVPDLIAVRGALQSSRYPTTAPELCIDILSPDDSLPRTFQKAAKYLNWGTKCVWVIDPERRIAWTLSPGTSEPTPVPSTGALRIGETVISMPDLFAKVDRKLGC
jgi:Uma2 family endonuclease